MPPLWPAAREREVRERRVRQLRSVPTVSERPPWENEDGSTNVTGFLLAYEDDDNTFWRADLGHIQNVLDNMIELFAAVERAVQLHGGTIVDGEFIRRGDDTSPVRIEWLGC